MTLSYLVPIRDDKRLMDDAILIDGMKEISVRDLLQLTVSCCRDDEGPEYRRALVNNFTNISTKMKLSRHDITTDKWSLTLDGFRGKLDDNRTVASFYVNGGKIENKVAPYATFKLVAGSEIEFRPPPQYRKLKFMRHLKFRVVSVNADDGVEEEAEVELIPAAIVEEEILPAVVGDEKEEEDDDDIVEEELVRSSSSAVAPRASSPSPNSNNSPAPVMASSMSYLAPFVASVLRDQVVTDLLVERRQQEDDRLQLEVTGRNGKPKYYKASMRDGQMTPTGDGFYVFFNRPLLPNFVDKIPRLEVRLGGVSVAPFHQMIAVTMPVERAGFDRTRGNAPQLGRIQFFSNRNDGVQVFGSMGPILPSDYANLPATMAVADLVRFVKHYQAFDGPYISAYMMCYLKILSIFVPTCQINGINFLDTPDKGTTTKNVWGEEKTQVEVIIPAIDVVADADIIDADNGVEEEEAEVVPVALLEEELEVDPAVAVDVDVEETNKDEVAQKDESIIEVPSNEVDGVEVPEEEEVIVSAVVDEENAVVAPVIDVPSFEEIQRAMGFSPLNNTIDSVPHDEDLLSWSLRNASPRPSRRSIYDPIKID